MVPRVGEPIPADEELLKIPVDVSDHQGLVVEATGRGELGEGWPAGALPKERISTSEMYWPDK